jgi:hypothetical protein
MHLEINEEINLFVVTDELICKGMLKLVKTIQSIITSIVVS